jgi:hypothetical protein
MAKIKNSDIVEDGFLKPTIDSVNNLIDGLKTLEEQTKKNLEASKKFFQEQKSATNVKDIEKQAEQTKKLSEEEAKLMAIKEAESKLKKQLIELNDEEVKGKLRFQQANAEQKKALKDEIVLLDKMAGTLDKLAAENRKLARERKGLNLETEKGRKRLTEINKKLDENNKFIKENVDALSKQKINIGNYESALSGVNSKIGGFITGIRGATKAALTFIATPLGMVIAAIGLALGAVATYFTKTEEGQDKWNKVSQVGSAIIAKLTDYVIILGEKLIWMFTSPKEAMEEFWNFLKTYVIDKFNLLLEGIGFVGSAIGKLFKGDFQGAMTDAGKAVESLVIKMNPLYDIVQAIKEEAIDMGVELEIAAKRGAEVADQQRKIRKLEREYAVESKKIALEVAKLKQKAIKEEGEERIKTIQQAIDLEEKAGLMAVNIANEKLKLAKLQASISQNDIAMNDALIEAEANYWEAQRIQYDQTLKLQQKMETEWNKIIADRKKGLNDTLMQRKEEKKSIDDVNEATKRSIKLLEEKMAKDEKDLALQKKKAEQQRAELIDLAQKTANTVKLYEQEVNDVLKERQKLLDEEMRKRERNIDFQRQLAAEGNEIAAQQVQFEEQKLKEAEIQKARTLKKEQQTKELIAMLNSYWAAFERFLGDPNVKPQQAAGKALAEVGKGVVTAQGVKLLVDAAFIDGTENVGESLGNKGKVLTGAVDNYLGLTRSGHAIAFDGNERIINPDDNTKLAGITNDELVNLGVDFKKGRLGYFITPQVREKKDNTTVRLERKLDSVEQAIKNKPVQRIDVDGLGNMVERVYRDKHVDKITYVRRRGKI